MTFHCFWFLCFFSFFIMFLSLKLTQYLFIQLVVELLPCHRSEKGYTESKNLNTSVHAIHLQERLLKMLTLVKTEGNVCKFKGWKGLIFIYPC